MKVSSSIVFLFTEAVLLDCANMDCDSISLHSCDWSTDCDHEVSLPIACNATNLIKDEELLFLPSPVECSTPKKFLAEVNLYASPVQKVLVQSFRTLT